LKDATMAVSKKPLTNKSGAAKSKTTKTKATPATKSAAAATAAASGKTISALHHI
jgi:hypothetical protein